MTIHLHRTTPPSDPSEEIGRNDLGDPVLVDAQGTVQGCDPVSKLRYDVLQEEVICAFEDAVAQIFGEPWMAGFTLVTGITRPRRKFNTDRQTIPANVLRWLAWIMHFDNPRAVGAAMAARKLDPTGEGAEVAEMAIAEITKP